MLRKVRITDSGCLESSYDDTVDRDIRQEETEKRTDVRLVIVRVVDPDRQN